MLATLPTRRDEDWRYADLGALDPATLERWEEIAVPPGGSFSDCRTLTGAGAAEIARLRIAVGEGGACALFVTNAAGRYGRVELAVRLERGAQFSFGGVTLGGGATTREFVTNVTHAAPDARSRQVIRSVHWGKGTGNFLGRIEVARGADGTDAAQSFKAMLLDPGAAANTRPELEIFADDVKCAHGASVGALDDAAAFYMAARGIDPATARALLIRAFIADAFVALPDEAQRDGMLDRALAALEGRA